MNSNNRLDAKPALLVPNWASQMPGDWLWQSLTDICTAIVDCPHSTPEVVEDGAYLMARTSDILTGVFRSDEARRVSPETFYERIQRAEPEFGDLLYSREGTYFGIAAEVPRGVRICLGQRMVLLRPNFTNADPTYLRYWLNSPRFQAYIHGHRDGTVAERLNVSTIRRLPVCLPPLPEQQAIAHVLGTLDDKIELNRRMNQTLEEMARALFKSWFVDFDPVRAKAEGREPVGMDAETAALFPDGFEDSELGPIPEGWTVGSIGQIARNVRDPVKPSDMPTGTPYIGLEHMPRGNIALSEWGDAHDTTSGKSAFEENDILFGKLRPYFHKVGFAPVGGVCSTDILVVRPQNRGWFGVLLEHLSSVDFINYTDASSSGTRMPRTNWRDMSRFQVVLPDIKLAEVFTDRIVLPTIKKIRSNILQNRTLAETRDALLPKLLSGELRIDDPEKFLAATLD